MIFKHMIKAELKRRENKIEKHSFIDVALIDSQYFLYFWIVENGNNKRRENRSLTNHSQMLIYLHLCILDLLFEEKRQEQNSARQRLNQEKIESEQNRTL